MILRLLGLISILSITACSTTPKNNNQDWLGYTESGIASYYADKHQNQKTASGERYRHRAKTAAHKKLPFGTKVKVTNVNNDKSVVVTINDRGPFVRGRIIDLSKSAFQKVSDTRAGTAQVKIEVVP